MSKGDKGRRLYTFRASADLRVLLAKQGNIYLLLEAGHHDAIYGRAERMTFLSNPPSGFVGLVESAAEPDGAGPGLPTTGADPRIPAGPGPLDHWADGELAEAGFGAGEVAAIRRGTAAVDGHERSRVRRAGHPLSVSREEPVRLPGVSAVRLHARRPGRPQRTAGV